MGFGSIMEEVKKREVTRVHKMINGMGNNVVDVLPVIHVL